MAAEQLLVTEGKDRGALLSVEADLVLGRVAPEEEGRLGGDPEISRRHARISRAADGRLQIEDLGSANGTFVDEERITTPRVLALGEVIRLGRTALKVTPGPAQESSPDEGAVVTRAPSAEPPAAVWELVITGGSASGRRLSLRDELLIGRTVSGDGRLSDDHQLSRRHARVFRNQNEQLAVEDLGSANGTFVNGERLSALRMLGPEDVLRVGTTTLELRQVGSRAAAPAAQTPPAPEVRRPPRTPAPPAPPPRPASPPPAVARRPPSPIPAKAPAAAVPSLPELPSGSVFAGCRVEQMIGQGDMGVVYRADELALQRPVALKLLLPEHSQNERFRERFRRESKIAAAIDHPNVIPVFDAGDEGGILYIMMRLVEGTDLRELITDEGPLEPSRAAGIVRHVAAALDAAHARGMLHRDVKPSNVLLARRDHVYLTDFGLARRVDSEERLTRHGTIVARAVYVAPEQILNQGVDARADIYALACLLFEALTGEPPFARWTGGSEPLAHLEAPRPSPRELRPDLPAAFDEVVRRGMATDPDERYSSAGDLAQAALVAVGELERAGPGSIVATGEAAPGAVALGSAQAQPVREPDGAAAAGSRTLRFAIALAGLVIVAVGMVGALSGISTL